MAVDLDHVRAIVERVAASLGVEVVEVELRGGGKYILKQAVSGLVPGEILHRRKHGFGVPIRDWINEQLRDRIRDTLTDACTRQRGYFEPRYISSLLDEHERRRRDHCTALWALLMLELWHRTFVDHGAVSRPGRPMIRLASLPA